VIFDGTSVGAIASSGTGRRLVRTIFSEHGVTADDEIRRLVSMQSSRQSIVVVTNDKAIINDVRPLGVNPVSSDALLGVLRR
jgi:predicted RNA-binding protein with PIN domain